MNKKLIMMISSLSLIALVIVGISYSFYNGIINGTPSQLTIKAGDLDLSVTNSKVNTLSLMPIYSSDANTKGYKHNFSVVRGSNATLDGCYDLYLVVDSIGANLKNKYLKYRISDGTYSKEGNFSTSNVTYVGNQANILLYSNRELTSADNLHEYTITVWLAYVEDEDQSNILTGNNASRTITFHLEATGNIGTCADEDVKLYDYIADHAHADVNINFSVNTKTDTSSSNNGIFATDKTDTGNTVYYYRGAVDNNLIFASKCWKIIRTTETGGTKLIYNGDSSNGECDNTGANSTIDNSVFNTNYNDNAYVGYMYGTPGSSTYEATHSNTNPSTIKGVIDTFYTTNLSSFESFIEDTVYCNDRSIVAYDSDRIHSRFSEYTTLGYGTNATLYGSSLRAMYYTIVPSPTLECKNANDRFTKSNANGNGDLSNPIGLITLDEVVFAGYNTYQSNILAYQVDANTNYLYSDATFWTMTPTAKGNPGDANVGTVLSGGYTGLDAGHSYGVRPVIALNNNVVITEGDGSGIRPFIVSLNNN